MGHSTLRSAAALVWLLATGAVSADISYSYDTSALTNGRLAGAFTVTEAGIADGSITLGDISANFVLSDVSPPHIATTFTTPEWSPTIYTIIFGEIYVERSSGAIMSGDFYMSANDVETGQTLGLTTHSIGVSSGPAGIGIQTPLIVSGGGAGAGGGGPGGGPGANITYTFAATSLPVPPAGQLNGSFSVSRAAIADGIITRADIIAANFALTGSVPPYSPGIFTLADLGNFSGPGMTPEIRVDPVTGALRHDFWMTMGNIHLFPHHYIVFPGAVVSAGSGRGDLSLTVSGGDPAGGATPVELATLHPLALAAIAALLALIGAALLRRQRA